MTSTFRQRLMTSTMLIGAAAIASPALAQQTVPPPPPVQQPVPPPPPGQPEWEVQDEETPIQATVEPSRVEEREVGQQPVGEIVVTGSRIQRRDLDSTAPIAVVQDEEFQLSGTVNVEQVINTLPQVVPGTTAFNNNPGGGVATLQLRGLGATRTLVLVNGRRYMFFDVGQIVDLNTIPTFLINSVDVVTGGASAVYGSDAMAGVVNFRLRNDLQGIEAGTHYAITERGDGPRYGAHVALGTNFADGRGNITAFAEYFNRGEVFQGDRRFSAEALGDFQGELIPLGSSTQPFARVRDFFGSTGGEFTPGGRVFPVAGQTSRPATATDFYNYAPANFLMVPQERWLLGAYGQYEISPNFQPYAEVTFVNNRVQNELAPTPVTGFFDINVDVACQFVSAEDCARFQRAAAASGDPNIVEDAFIQRRVLEVGPRNVLDDRNAFRVLAGMTGEVTDWINYDSYYSYARTRNATSQAGNVSRSAFQAGLLDPDNPINIFGPGTLTPEMADAISVPIQLSDVSVLEVANLSLTGNRGNFGLGGDDIGFAVGAEWRRVDSEFIADAAFNVPGEIVGFNAIPGLGGGYSVNELFGELRVPIAGNMTGIEELELWGAARYSDYSLEAVGGVWTYAAGAQYAPIRDIRFRGQYSRAIRAPNVAALFAGVSPGFPPAEDPCAQPEAAADPTVRAVCIATGVPANRVGDPFLQINPQIPGLFGGNPNLEEETADTWTVGAVFSPRFIPRLNATVDYYDITIDNAIAGLGGGVANILNLCYNVVQDPTSVVCQAINRDPSGSISGDQFSVEVIPVNIAQLTSKGVDFQVDYDMPLNFGLVGTGRSRLNFFLLGSHTIEANVTPLVELPEQVIECAGRFGNRCGEPTPKWKWTSRLSFIDGPLTLSTRWRHIGAVRDDDPETDFVVERLGAVNYFDLTMAWDIGDNMRLTTGVRNIFDKKPPIMGDNQNQSNTWPDTYDVLGRDFFASALLRF